MNRYAPVVRVRSIAARKSLQILLVVTAAMAVLSLAGCGGGDVNAPPPTGQFSDSDLNGSYAFSFSGTDAFGFFAAAGSLQADGNGTITGGAIDLSSVNGAITNAALTGTYSIGADGRGTATLNSAGNPVTIAFVMLSSQRALVVRFENFGTGSGSMDRQTTSAFTTASLQGGFAFNLGGIDNVGNTFASAGNFTADTSGNLTNGAQDFNDSGAVNTNVALAGSWSVGAANGRGTATLTTSLGSLSFAFYVVDANHVKMVETDSVAILGGDGYRQLGPFTNSSLNGSFPFTLSGVSTTGSLVAGGIFTADGGGNLTGGVEDVNNGGNVVPNLAVSGSYSMATNGRGTMTLINPTGTSHFAVYPTTGGILMVELDVVIVSNGTAVAQIGSSFSNTSVNGSYGLNMSGAQQGFEIDAAAQFKASGSGSLSGALDINNGGSLFPNLALSGTYSLASNGRGTLVLQSSEGTLNFNFYMVNASRALFIEMDASLPSIGEFDAQ